jgi:hypothetical protein
VEIEGADGGMVTSLIVGTPPSPAVAEESK